METKTPEQIENECLIEITKVLEKHNCTIEVSFTKDSVLGTPVLKYIPTVIYKGQPNELKK
jgi:uncharacterized protein YejL (UPF0352 family)